MSRVLDMLIYLFLAQTLQTDTCRHIPKLSEVTDKTDLCIFLGRIDALHSLSVSYPVI